MGKKILVTGAAGFIGSHTVDQLLAAGHTVIGVDNFRTGRMENLKQASACSGFSLVQLDITDEAAFTRLVGATHPAAIIHLAALVSVPESIANPALNDRLNYQATRIVADAARHHQVRRIVFASSAAVYGDPAIIPTPEDAAKQPLSPYGTAKLASEALLFDYSRRFGIVVRCQRYFNVYGPRQDPRSPYSGVISIFSERIARRQAPTIFGDGEQTRDFIFVRDVARANMIAATADGIVSGVANICTGNAVSLNQLWQRLSHHDSLALQPSYAPSRSGDIRHSCGTPDEAFSALNFQASTPLHEGLESLMATMTSAHSQTEASL